MDDMIHYRSMNSFLREQFGEKVYKLALDGGFTCPTRDGTLDTRGCIFCAGGSGEFAVPVSDDVNAAIEAAKKIVAEKGGKKFIAYYQSFTGTYAPVSRLRELYTKTLLHPEIVALSIGTRPDCVDEEKLDYLARLASEGKVIVVEYGIESCYDETLKRINRGHDFECARKAVEMTARRGLDVGAHFILGLPGESRRMLLDQCSAISAMPLTSVKFHQLQIVKGTRMEREYSDHPEDFLRLGLEDYLDLVIDILERLRPDLCIERVAGEVPPRFVSETPWGLIRNDGILRLLDKRLEERDTFQGKLCDIRE